MRKILSCLLTFVCVVCATVGCTISLDSNAASSETGGKLASYTIIVYAETLDGEAENITSQYSEEFGELTGEQGSTVNIKKYVVTCAPKGYELDGEKSTLSGTLKSDNSLQLTLWYKLKTYTVSFGGYADEQKVKHGAIAQKPEDPSKENFSFEGWALYNAIFDFSTPITYNIALTPSWVSLSEEMSPGDSYTTDLYGACAVDKHGVQSNAQKSSEYFDGGLLYVLPSSGMEYEIVLPLINYAKYDKVTFEWRCQEDLAAGTDSSSWNTMKVEQSGTIEITSTQTGSLSIVMTHPQIGDVPHITYERHVTDSGIVNGKTALTLYGKTYGTNRWFSISLPTFTL